MSTFGVVGRGTDRVFGAGVGPLSIGRQTMHDVCRTGACPMTCEGACPVKGARALELDGAIGRRGFGNRARRTRDGVSISRRAGADHAAYGVGKGSDIQPIKMNKPRLVLDAVGIVTR